MRRASYLFVSPTYAKPGGHAPVENVGAPTFLIFLHIFRTFSHRRVAREFVSPLPLKPNPMSCQAKAIGLKLPAGIEAALARVKTKFGGTQR
jgi:hypothetical protein